MWGSEEKLVLIFRSLEAIMVALEAPWTESEETCPPGHTVLWNHFPAVWPSIPRSPWNSVSIHLKQCQNLTLVGLFKGFDYQYVIDGTSCDTDKAIELSINWIESISEMKNAMLKGERIIDQSNDEIYSHTLKIIKDCI